MNRKKILIKKVNYREALKMNFSISLSFSFLPFYFFKLEFIEGNAYNI